ncbi:receptor-like protein Cf-9 [Populus alba x Populus x berolinensis]|nr:receptor-like protein Cf-9 [Populus alba x Populus x berolinensis]
MMGPSLLLAQFLCLLFFHSHSQPAHSSSNFSSSVQLCPGDQSLALLQFKNSFSMMPSSPYGFPCYPPKKVLWKEGTDCCSWDGVTCNMKTGHVIGLDLGCSMLYGTLHSNSTLFSLHHLQKLDLSRNDFNRSVISSSFGQLLHLTHLNLNSSNFAGQVPPEISHLSRLVSLDLSFNSEQLMLEPISFNKLAQNLTQLRELHLGGVNMSLVVPSSLMNLSSSLSSLQLLFCGLKGELPDNLFRRSNLQWLDLWRNEGLTGSFPPYNLSNALSHLDLSHTRISIHLEPDSISHLKYVEMMYLERCNFVGSNLGLLGNLTQLIELGLAGNQFGGQIPLSFGKLKHLEYLDLGNNNFMGPIPDVFVNQTQLALLDTVFKIPSSLGNLKKLNSLKLSSNNFSGKIPYGFFNLTQLTSLDLSNNKFDGQIPSSLGNLKKLDSLELSSNNFSGKISYGFFNLPQLTYLDLSNNKFDGQIPSSLGNLKKLDFLELSSNNFSGKIPYGFFNLTQLTSLDLSNNKFDGQIPSSLGNLKKLDSLELSSNNFSSKISYGFFNLPQLTYLDLSNNKFDGQIPSSLGNLKKLDCLILSFNNFSGKIPDGFFNLTQLRVLDLSNNTMIGSIPSQITRLSGLHSLDLSHNLLNGTIPSTLFSMPSLRALFLHNNLLYGQISPFLCNSLQYIDFSHNRLYGQIPPSVFKLEHLRLLMLSSNDKLTGNISSAICELKSLEILDLSNNGFSGFIPQCLGNFSDGLSVLHLGANNLHGNIPSIYSEGNSLRYLNFNGNQLKGVIPPSIINCVNLEFLDLGNNMIDDTFPSFLETLPKLEVVVLRSNKLHGSLKGPTVKDSFSKLQIFDLSNNSLSGPLPTEYFNNFKAMMSVAQDMDYMTTKNHSYVYSVTLAWKGLEIEFSQIQIALATLDLSCNKFTGKIPESLGKLKSLIQLNLSHNSLIGYIQPSLGNLTNLESLDLSSNLLAGRIPQQLVDLTFLQVLNLSYNQLEGPIPQGKQFNTFENGSYEGNLGLCGFPLQVKCYEGGGQPSNLEKEDSMFEEGFGWKAVAMGYGCGFVFGVSIGYVVFRARKPAWFVKMVEDSAHQNAKRLRRKNAPRNGGRRY